MPASRMPGQPHHYKAVRKRNAQVLDENDQDHREDAKVLAEIRRIQLVIKTNQVKSRMMVRVIAKVRAISSWEWGISASLRVAVGEASAVGARRQAKVRVKVRVKLTTAKVRLANAAAQVASDRDQAINARVPAIGVRVRITGDHANRDR